MASALKGVDHNFTNPVVGTQFALLIQFAQLLGSYRAVKQDFGKIIANNQFWIRTADSYLLRAVTDWCKVFGVDDNESHWKSAAASDPVKFTLAVRDVILNAAGFTQAQWEAYHTEVRNFRNSYVAHRNIVLTGNIPDMTPAMKIAEAYFAWLKVQIPGSGQPKPLAEWYLEAETETLIALRRDWAI